MNFFKATLSLTQLEERDVPSANAINLVNLETTYNPNDQSIRTIGVTARLEVEGSSSGGILAPKLSQDVKYTTTIYWAESASLMGRQQQAEEKSHTIQRGRGTHNIPPFGDSFNARELGRPPSWAKYAISVIRVVGATETNTKDNITAVDLKTRKSTPVVEGATAPKTFVILLGGFLSKYSEPLGELSGMKKLEKEILADGRLGQNILTLNGRGTGPAILHDTRIGIDQYLRSKGYTPKDRVILIGHSLGGDAARTLAADVSTGYAGAQSAAALVMIDPISFRRVQETGGRTDQSGEEQPRPAGVKHILNLVQTASGPKGYRILGLDKNDDVVGGPKITHTTIDDDPTVQKRIINFLASI